MRHLLLIMSKKTETTLNVSQNETLITHYEKKTETTLNVSYFEIMSH